MLVNAPPASTNGEWRLGTPDAVKSNLPSPAIGLNRRYGTPSSPGDHTRQPAPSSPVAPASSAAQQLYPRVRNNGHAAGTGSFVPRPELISRLATRRMRAAAGNAPQLLC